MSVLMLCDVVISRLFAWSVKSCEALVPTFVSMLMRCRDKLVTDATSKVSARACEMVVSMLVLMLCGVVISRSLHVAIKVLREPVRCQSRCDTARKVIE